MLTAGHARTASHDDNADPHVRPLSVTPAAATMALIVPFAGPLSDAGRQALSTLTLPHLERLLGQCEPGPTLGGDAFSLSTPHELALASARGWPLADGALPWACAIAAGAGIDPGDRAWALLTPVHLQVGADRITLTDPQAMALDAHASRALLEAVRELFESEGFGLHWLDAERWLATHEVFDGLATASLDRVAGRHIGPWLPTQPQARRLRRLQNEAQMLLHTHPLNDEREAAGLARVNSFWCSGCGRALPVATSPAASIARLDDRLRRPALDEDWTAWREAWAAIDAGPVAALLQSGDDVALTLCGERIAQRFERRRRSPWQRLRATWRRASARAVLEAL